MISPSMISSDTLRRRERKLEFLHHGISPAGTLALAGATATFQLS
jgi:hypothetical protein